MVDVNDALSPKTCPFCGGVAELRHNSSWAYEVRCTICHARTRQFQDNPNGAVSTWNKRDGETSKVRMRNFDAQKNGACRDSGALKKLFGDSIEKEA